MRAKAGKYTPGEILFCSEIGSPKPLRFSNRSVPDWAMISGEKTDDWEVKRLKKWGDFGEEVVALWMNIEPHLFGHRRVPNKRRFGKGCGCLQSSCENDCIFLRIEKNGESELSFLNFETDKKCKNKMVCTPLLRNWSKQVWIWVEETY